MIVPTSLRHRRGLLRANDLALAEEESVEQLEWHAFETRSKILVGTASGGNHLRALEQRQRPLLTTRRRSSAARLNPGRERQNGRTAVPSPCSIVRMPRYLYAHRLLNKHTARPTASDVMPKGRVRTCGRGWDSEGRWAARAARACQWQCHWQWARRRPGGPGHVLALTMPLPVVSKFQLEVGKMHRF